MTYTLQIDYKNADEVAICLEGLNIDFAMYQGRGEYMEFFINDIDIHGFDILEAGFRSRDLI